MPLRERRRLSAKQAAAFDVVVTTYDVSERTNRGLCTFSFRPRPPKQAGVGARVEGENFAHSNLIFHFLLPLLSYFRRDVLTRLQEFQPPSGCL